MTEFWIFSVEDSQKLRYFCELEGAGPTFVSLRLATKAEEHEFMIDSGCYGHVCPPWFAPQFLFGEICTNVEAVAASNEALRHYRTRKCCMRTRDDEQWQTSFHSDHLRRDERATNLF